jgi:hypothetical protein
MRLRRLPLLSSYSLNLARFGVLFYLLLVSFAFFCGFAAAQETLRVRAHEFYPSRVAVGDSFELKLLIEAEKGKTIYAAPINVSQLPHVESEAPKVKKVKPKAAAPGKVYYEAVYPLRAFAPGSHTLPPITISAGEAKIQTDAYAFQATPVKPDGATTIKDIDAPLAPPSNWLLYVFGVIFIIAVAGAMIFWYMRRQKQTALPPQAAPQLSPHEIALARLNEIEALNLVAKGEMKRYHTEISHAIREYIAMRYDIPALELTTEDLLNRLSDADLPDAPLSLLRHFLTQCNLVKFAKQQPGKLEAHARLDEAQQFIEATKPPIQIKSEPEEQINETVGQ